MSVLLIAASLLLCAGLVWLGQDPVLKEPEEEITFTRLTTDIFHFCNENNLNLPIYADEWEEVNKDLTSNTVYVINRFNKPIGLIHMWADNKSSCIHINPIEISKELCGNGYGSKAVAALLGGRSLFGPIDYISAEATAKSIKFWIKQGARFSMNVDIDSISSNCYLFTLTSRDKLDKLAKGQQR